MATVPGNIHDYFLTLGGRTECGSTGLSFVYAGNTNAVIIHGLCFGKIFILRYQRDKLLESHGERKFD